MGADRDKLYRALVLSNLLAIHQKSTIGRLSAYCGAINAGPHCHFVRRAQGGLGTEENIWTGCQRCHEAFDSEATDGPLHARMRDYFKTLYPQWDESKLKYKKWEA